ncbi:50S ribosomal protein L5 [Candidatus Saccharibacteria bacterium]|nr:50S ribosomal protein L5 [Candidatus Saccharibacteria bacterium]
MATDVTSKPISTTSRLKALYQEKYASALKDELKLKNINQAPRLEKIIINAGLGRAKDDKRLLEVATNTLRKISGQQPVRTTARASIAGFKLRAGSQVGLKVTLRGDRMYEFADRLISLVLPRLRDFHGVSPKSFDSQGNYSLGLGDQSVFPELTFEDTATPHGLQVVFVISNLGKEHSRALLEKLGLPFEKPTDRAPSTSSGQDRDKEEK